MSFGFTQGFHNRNTLGFTTESGDFRLTHENRHKYLVTSKCFFQSILLQDTIIQPNYYLITRYSYSVRKVSYYKILLLFSVSNYYLQDSKIRYCPSLTVSSMKDCLKSLVKIHFFFLNVVDFFQRILCLDSKQLNLVRLQILKEPLQ